MNVGKLMTRIVWGYDTGDWIDPMFRKKVDTSHNDKSRESLLKMVEENNQRRKNYGRTR